MRHCSVSRLGSCSQNMEIASPALEHRPGTSPVLMYRVRKCLHEQMLPCSAHTHMSPWHSARIMCHDAHTVLKSVCAQTIDGVLEERPGTSPVLL